MTKARFIFMVLFAVMLAIFLAKAGHGLGGANGGYW
jgi:hypothetical protein